MIENDFLLLESDKISATWHRLQIHLLERLKIYSKRLEGDLDSIQTAKVRGQILEVRRILALADEKPIVEE